MRGGLNLEHVHVFCFSLVSMHFNNIFIHKPQLTLLLFPILPSTETDYPLVVFRSPSGCVHVTAIVGFLLHLSFNCILPRIILKSLQRQGTFIMNQVMKAECVADEAVLWLSEMFCMIQCLLLEMSHSRRLGRVDASLKAKFLVWR